MSYNPALASPIDRARFVLADTDTSLNVDNSSNELLPDATYASLIGLYGLRAGIMAAAAHLVVLYAQYPDKVSESGGKSLTWSERIKAWEKVASGEFTIPSSIQPQRAVSKIGLITAPDGSYLRNYVPGEFGG